MFGRRPREIFPENWKRELVRCTVVSLVLVGIYHVGLVIPAPGFTLPASEMKRLVDTYALLEIHNHFIAGGGLYIGVGVLSLGFAPYLQAEPLVALLEIFVPRLRHLAREGEYGRRRLERIKVGVAVALAVLNATLFVLWIDGVGSTGARDFSGILVRVGVLTAGSLFTLYLVKLLNEEWRGKGLVILLTSNVMSGAVAGTLGQLSGLGASPEAIARFAGAALAMAILIWVATVIDLTKRRIPVVHPRQATSTRKSSAQSSFVPIALDYASGEDAVLAGFCTAYLALGAAAVAGSSSLTDHLKDTNDPVHFLVVVVFLFAFSVMFATTKPDAAQLADDLKKQGTFIPGIRPGEPTTRYVETVGLRTALVGAVIKVAIFAVLWSVCALGLVAGEPVLLFSSLLVSVFLGGSIVDQIEAIQLTGRYEGFLKKGRIRQQ